jgi:hypothetical protein
MFMAESKHAGLFSVLEAFVRAGQLREKGCLLIFNKKEEMQLFVDDGNVVHAAGRQKTGYAALEQALKLDGAAFEWLPGAQAPKRDLQVNIHEYAMQNSSARDTTMTKTNTVALPAEREKPAMLAHRYFFVPEGAPHVKLILEKTTSIAGRDPGCDLHLVSTQVSRQHCVIEITDRGLLVKDLDSKNGTFVNGIAMKDGYVNEGDKLSFGSYTLKVCRERG